MPAGMTFDTLKEEVGRYLERGITDETDQPFAVQLPYLVNTAERRIARDLKIQGLQNTVVSNFVAGTSVYAKPDRWRETISMNFGSGTGNATRNLIFPRAYEYLRAYWPDDSVQGTPKFYAEYDAQHWLVLPTPSTTNPFEVLYYQLPELLSDDTQTNWLTEYAPELLLYATLYESALYLRKDDDAARWLGVYNASRGAITTEDMQKIIDRTSTRVTV